VFIRSHKAFRLAEATTFMTLVLVTLLLSHSL
jgi:hypothetical protein